MVSFWEKESLLHTDIAIIGGGITGLSVAASLIERNPGVGITVFERSLLPYGASTRNAGFACFGSLTEVLADAEAMGWDATVSLVSKRFRGIQKTRNRLGDGAIGFEASGGFELLQENQRGLLHQLETANTHLSSIFLKGYFSRQDHLLKKMGLLVSGNALVSIEGEGQVHTGKLMKSLEKYVVQKGVAVRTGANCTEIEKDGDNHLLVFRDPVRGNLEVRSKTIIVCTNAFAKNLFHSVNVVPGRGQVFITKPISGLKFKGNLHLDEGFYYLRNVGNRLLFGGARNLDFKGEETTEFQLNQKLQQHLENTLYQLFDGNVKFEVEQRWAGIMAFGDNKQPIVKEVSPGVYCALKLSGMGIALAAEIGEEVAEMLSL